ncbi:hypothetical protein ACH5RR_006940 [Cinchona calisaya]|uniref:Uncharacterized protein n=1 Tax=Cinchona calisaya TaxID=153742 RepID=A0ABD3AQV6_9GENT
MALRLNWKLVSIALVMLVMMASRATARTLNYASMTYKHEQWMNQYGRVYEDNIEKATRYKIFKENVEFIESFNKAGNQPYELGMNKFADLTNEEFRKARNGYIPWKDYELKSFMYANASAVPSTMDWREKGAVTSVKDQGQCAVAAMEGINQLTTGKLISLSEQELVDCDRDSEDQGCGGGFMDDAFKFIINNKGLTTESNYPYQGTDGTCNASKEANHAAKITGFEDVPANNEAALLKAVANQPVSVAIDAGGSAFQFYSSGIFTGDCGTDLNHGVTIVGYGATADGTKYWLVKNSWGTSWGENGYVKMQRDIDAAEGLCGIAMQASYPTSL